MSGPMVVIGAGRIGTALRLRAEARGLPVVTIDRHHHWDALDGDPGEPVIVAVRNDVLDAVFARVPARRLPDLVLVQNGAIRELLDQHGLSNVTRGILYVMAARKGDDLLPGEVSVFTGPHAEAVAAWLTRLEIPAAAVDRAAFAEIELEKLLWLACMGLLCEVHGAPVGVVARDHADEVRVLVDELAPIGRGAWGVEADAAHLTARILSYSASIPDYHAAVKEWPWRNGWLRDQALRLGLPTPVHDRLLEQTGHLR